MSIGRYHCFGRISLSSVKVVKGHSSILGIGNRTESFPGISAGKESACNARNPGLIPGLRSSPGEGLGYLLQYSWAFLVAQLVKNLTAMWETWVQSLGWEDPLRRKRLPIPIFWPGEFHGLYSPWGHNESDMTE